MIFTSHYFLSRRFWPRPRRSPILSVVPIRDRGYVLFWNFFFCSFLLMNLMIVVFSSPSRRGVISAKIWLCVSGSRLIVLAAARPRTVGDRGGTPRRNWIRAAAKWLNYALLCFRVRLAFWRSWWFLCLWMIPSEAAAAIIKYALPDAFNREQF